MYYEDQEWDKSLQCFQKASQISPDVWVLQEHTALLLLRVGQLEQAEATIVGIESRWPEDEKAMAKVRGVSQAFILWVEGQRMRRP